MKSLDQESKDLRQVSESIRREFDLLLSENHFGPRPEFAKPEKPLLTKAEHELRKKQKDDFYLLYKNWSQNLFNHEEALWTAAREKVKELNLYSAEFIDKIGRHSFIKTPDFSIEKAELLE